MFKNKTAESSAKVVDGNLIISLPDAKDPVVWRMALGEARAAALEVRPKDADYALVLKYPKGDTTEIAPFASKETATRALMAVSKAMQESHGHIRPASGTPPTADSASAGSSASWKWLIPLILIILGIFFLNRSASMLPSDYAGNETAGTATAPGGASDETGVPLSADSFLNGM